MARGIRIISLACLWLAPLFILYHALNSNWTSVWEEIRVPAVNPPFLDLRVITSGVKTLQQGGDPLIANSLDPLHRPLNYPRIWLHIFSVLGINDSNVQAAGVALCVLYLICISWLILRSEGSVETVVLLIGGLSLAPLLAFERGNIDLFIFALVFLACVVPSRFLKSAFLFVGTMLKIYPIAAMAVDAIRRPVRQNLVPVAAMLSGAAIWVLKWRELNAIRHATPVIQHLAFGTLVLRAQAPFFSWIQVATFLTLAALIVGLTLGDRPKVEEGVLNSKSGEMFLAFGGIYAFCFLFGANFNYRLIFLVPTLPLVLELAQGGKHTKWAFIYIASVMAAENSIFFGVYEGIPLGDLATCVLLVMILPILLQHAKYSFLRAPATLQPPASNAALPQK